MPGIDQKALLSFLLEAYGLSYLADDTASMMDHKGGPIYECKASACSESS